LYNFELKKTYDVASSKALSEYNDFGCQTNNDVSLTVDSGTERKKDFEPNTEKHIGTNLPPIKLLIQYYK